MVLTIATSREPKHTDPKDVVAALLNDAQELDAV